MGNKTYPDNTMDVRKGQRWHRRAIAAEHSGRVWPELEPGEEARWDEAEDEVYLVDSDLGTVVNEGVGDAG